MLSTSSWFASSLSTTTGSTQGHIITVQTNGMAKSKTDTQLHVYSVCTGSTKELKIISAAPNQIVFQN